MITDNTTKWRVKKVTEFIGNSLPIGHIYQTIAPTVPAGSLPLFGGTYSRTLYADLWAWVQQQSGFLITESQWQSKASANDGNVPFFSSGDGSTTFRVPSMKCWVKGANGVSEVGSYLEAGLPNITGELHLVGASSSGWYTNTTTGAFSATKVGTDTKTQFQSYGTAGSDIKNTINFNASQSDSTFGNSETVQPPSIVGMWCIVAYGTVSNVGNADVANAMQAVEQVQTDLSNLERGVGSAVDYIVESYRNGTEWYEVYKSGKVRQGGTITVATSSIKTITLKKAFANTNYTLTIGYSSSTDEPAYKRYLGWCSKTTTNFTAWSAHGVKDWIAEGQGA